MLLHYLDVDARARQATAQPERPKFSILRRVVFGVIAIGTIYLLLWYLGHIPGQGRAIGIWLVSFMDYDLGYIDLEEKTLQPLNKR